MAAPGKNIHAWIVVSFVVPALLLISTAMARSEESTLGRFEQEVRKENKKQSDDDEGEDEEFSSHEHYHSDFASDVDFGLGDLLHGMLITGGYGTVNSMQRITGTSDVPEVVPRLLGEPLLPFAALDYTKQFIEDDLRADSYRLEVGYGPLALEYFHTAYREDEPFAELDFKRVNGLLRMSFGDSVECDIGLGVLSMEGEGEYSGFSWSVPVLFHPTQYFGFEIRPSWAIINDNTISDFDAALVIGPRYLFLRAGYRWVKTGDLALEGGYLGLSLRY